MCIRDRGYKKWFLNLSAKVQKKNVKKERIGAYYGKNSVIIETFLNVCANSGRYSLDVYKRQVTASAEQIPSTCTVTGLFKPSGVKRTSLFFLENNALIFYLPSSYLLVKNELYMLRQSLIIASTPLEVIVPPEIPST